ncbi:MAG: SAM-dependent methyltransferase [Granulosicoccus sp.]|jgi:SAM-dependent methyltransferase
MWRVLLQKYGVCGSVRLFYRDVLPDLIQGIDTASPVDNLKLTSLALAREHNRYVPSTFDALNSSLGHISNRVDFSQCSFLDYGSGKGKARIAAARYPFSNITGVEISSELHAIACRNIERLDLVARVRCVLADASTYPLRRDDTVLYFLTHSVGQYLSSVWRPSLMPVVA